MYILFVSALSLILFLCFVSVYLMQKSRVSICYLLMNVSIFFYILSIFSVLFSADIIYFRFIFAFGNLSVLMIYVLLKEMANMKYRWLDKLYLFGSGLFSLLAISTSWVVESVQETLVETSLVRPLLYELNYGRLYYGIILMILFLILKGAFEAVRYYRNVDHKLPIIYSWGSIAAFLILSILSNAIYPMLFGSSKYSFLVVFWTLILSVGNFIAIIKYQYLNVRLVFSKSLWFLFFWAALFSFLFCIGMFFYAKLLVNSVIGIISGLLFFVLIYNSIREILDELLTSVLGGVNNDINQVYLDLSKELLNAKSLTHIFIAMNKFIDFMEADQWYGSLTTYQGEYLKSDLNQPQEIYHVIESKIYAMEGQIQIKVENNYAILMLKLIREHHVYGWFYVRFPIYKYSLLRRHRKRLMTINGLCINSIQLIFSYDNINHKIKHLTNANEFVSRLSLTSVNTISTMILNQLKQTFGFDHVILPQFSHYGMEWSSSTVYVPEDIRDLIYAIEIPNMFKFPYDPICFKMTDYDASNQLVKVCEYYESDECYLLPIVQDDLLVGYYMGFSKQKNNLVDMNLLSIINKQISTILYRSIVNNKIATTKHFYQEIIDYLSSIIVVLNENFEIQFSNKNFKTFFSKNYASFNELIYDYPSLEIINKIIDFSDTELTIQIKKQHFKVSLKHLMDNNIIVLLTNVTDLVKIQHSISKSSKLRGMGTFVAGVAHEIKNPLVAVKTFTQLISKDWTNDDIRSKCQQIVLPQLHRINNLSQSLNYFGKTEKNSFEPTNLSQLIYETQELLRGNQQFNSSIQIKLDIEPNVMVFANAQMLIQVLLNLSLNAIDAVKGASHPTIKFHLFTDSTTKVILDFNDNGTGIGAADVQHLFDPFFTTKDSGTGLGLSIVHQIISDHQGSISLHNTDDSGTTFRLVLPKLLRPKKILEFSHDY